MRRLLLSGLTGVVSTAFMECGDAPLCGVLVVETGLGPEAYHHDFVSVHGLWPETGSYGSSKCIAPTSSPTDPSSVFTCYNHPGGAGMAPLDFEKHEWGKHGVCAGVKDVNDFFGQVCSLSSGPLKVLATVKAAGHTDLNDYKQQLESAGYPVFSTDTVNSQFQLSACASSDGQWKLAAVADFGSVCGANSKLSVDAARIVKLAALEH